jgi:transcriptional regulator
MITRKEIEVLRLKKKGLTQLEISKKLKISQPAVSKFYNNALKKIKQAKEILEMEKEINKEGKNEK